MDYGVGVEFDHSFRLIMEDDVWGSFACLLLLFLSSSTSHHGISGDGLFSPVCCSPRAYNKINCFIRLVSFPNAELCPAVLADLPGPIPLPVPPPGFPSIMRATCSQTAPVASFSSAILTVALCAVWRSLILEIIHQTSF